MSKYEYKTNVRIVTFRGQMVFYADYMQERPLKKDIPAGLYAYDIACKPDTTDPAYIVKAAYRYRYGTIITNKQLNFDGKLMINDLIFFDQEKSQEEIISNESEVCEELDENSKTNKYDWYDKGYHAEPYFPESILKEIYPEMFDADEICT